MKHTIILFITLAILSLSCKKHISLSEEDIAGATRHDTFIRKTEKKPGCISDAPQCLGACNAGEFRSCLGCENRVGGCCVRVKQLDGTYRYECWSLGPGIHGQGPDYPSGVDVPDAVFDEYAVFDVSISINGSNFVLTANNLMKSQYKTVAFFDTNISYSTHDDISYKYDFFNSTNQLLWSVIW